jgi:hypothetical protein
VGAAAAVEIVAVAGEGLGCVLYCSDVVLAASVTHSCVWVQQYVTSLTTRDNGRHAVGACLGGGPWVEANPSLFVTDIPKGLPQLQPCPQCLLTCVSSRQGLERQQLEGECLIMPLVPMTSRHTVLR